MKLMGLMLIVSILQSGAAFAQERGRIKTKPPNTHRGRSHSVGRGNDGSLHKGDIVSTDRGFFLDRGLGSDGYTYDFVRVPNPLSSRQP
jgi:hypothetical protein